MIGVFDSGVGGLSVWREIVKLIPDAPILYLADQAHVPYGQRSLDEARALTTRCAQWLIERGCDMIVIACNAASAAALHELRARFPQTAFIGMEPAVKPAALQTHTGVIGVLATRATFQGRLFASVVERFAITNRVRVIEQACPEWVEIVERGMLTDDRQQTTDDNHSPAVHRPSSVVSQRVLALLDQNVDALVLGCTHFPFLKPAIQRVIDDWRTVHPQAPEVKVIDPSPAVAQQTLRVWQANERLSGFRNLSGLQERHAFWTTGSAEIFAYVAASLLPELHDIRVRHLEPAFNDEPHPTFKPSNPPTSPL